MELRCARQGNVRATYRLFAIAGSHYIECATECQAKHRRRRINKSTLAKLLSIAHRLQLQEPLRCAQSFELDGTNYLLIVFDGEVVTEFEAFAGTARARQFAAMETLMEGALGNNMVGIPNKNKAATL